jgi:hypothetical protein
MFEYASTDHKPNKQLISDGSNNKLGAANQIPQVFGPDAVKSKHSS